jgi:hypothetical protein
MKRKLLATLLVASLALGLASAPAVYAYTVGAPYTWDASVPNYNPSAVIHSGTIDTTSLVMGDFLGVSAGNPNAPGYGDSGVSVGWDDTWVGSVGHPNTNGDNLDGLWAQIIYPAEGWWDLGAATDRVAVFLSQDHGPYPAEGLEYRIYGSNTLWGAVGAQAVLTDVYLDGWRSHNPAEDGNGNGWCSDDVAAVLQLDGTYRYVKLAAWSPGGGLNEPEVDAVAAVSIEVDIDIKPMSWPNPLNVNNKGVLPVAILGTEDFDVSQIDPASILLEGVSPLRWALEDVGTVGDPLAGPDGITDLSLKFAAQEIVAALGDVTDGEVVTLHLTGNLKEEFGGTPIEGEDVMRIIKKK